MSHIYHITTRVAWEAAQADGHYEAPSLATEGLIHLSTEEQVAGVLDRYYKGAADLVRLTVDTDKLTHELKYELAPSVNEEFPHVYGPINLDAVIAVDAVN
ncbi:MAG: hypothetical protein JWP27_2233 [Flaviaesturariibacter sp.]|nr:hypothetical protein [Flaviaesturariibacter sp.]